MGGPGACAVKAPGRPIVLGALTREQCRGLAETVRDLDYEGVVGVDLAPVWFVERAAELGAVFADPIPQRIHVLRAKPAYPPAPGQARQVVPEDAPLLADWTAAFVREAVPDDPVPTREEIERAAGEGRHFLWMVAGEPVAMAAIARRLRTAAAISQVFTPPAHRGRGYAGSVTAAVVERIFGEGRTAACLYTDLRNPASNRCYARIGFTPLCDAWAYWRRAR